MALINSFRLFLLASAFTAAYFTLNDERIIRALRAPSGGDNSAENALIDTCGNMSNVALTYDDGPNVPGGTSSNILDAALAAGIPLTFHFPIEPLKNSNSAKDFAKRVRAEGHLIGLRFRVGVTDFSAISPADFTQMLVDDANSMKNMIGVIPKYIRLGSGSGFTQAHIDVARKLGFVFTRWSIDAFDGADATNSKIIAQYTNGFKDKDSTRVGAIALNHDGSMTAVNASADLYRYIKNIGKTFVNLKDCLKETDEYIAGFPAAAITSPNGAFLLERNTQAMTMIMLLAFIFALI